MQDNQNLREIIPPVNDSPYKRILVIGDVHAAYNKLQSLWKKLSVTDNDLVIFLGDYLYGMGDGDKNVETLHWLIEHKKRSCVNILTGEFWQSSANTNSESVSSILFVCSGNTCRSPMAKYIMRHLLKQLLFLFSSSLQLFAP